MRIKNPKYDVAKKNWDRYNQEYFAICTSYGSQEIEDKKKDAYNKMQSAYSEWQSTPEYIEV
jgi:hypothetical protein